MSDNSPLFFMKEFSNEELSQLLVNKVKELKKAKAETDELNNKLNDTVANLEKLQSKLSQQNEDLENKVKEKTKQVLNKEKFATIGELSARIAHDLRNPLSVLKNSLEIMRIELEPAANESTLISLSRMDRAVDRISHQVDDVLDYLKPSKLCVARHSLLLILQDTVDRIGIPDNIQIKIPKNDCIIPCDNDKIETVFVNLLSNAIQAMGYNSGQIVISFSENQDSSSIKITDNGPGIPHDLIDKIFDPLFTTRQIGTGLGLPSCKSIVERHGGNISVSTKIKQGTTFTITLPTKTEFENIGKESGLPNTINNLKAGN